MGNQDFDSNAWYQITESNLDFSSSLQVDSTYPSSIFMGTACKTCLQNWQIIPSNFGTGNAPNGSFVLRNQATGTTKQLGTCSAPTEINSSKTRPCMVDASIADLAGPFTKWDITDWEDQGKKIVNLGNGTDYNLDCHTGNPLYLSTATAPQPKHAAQHWMFSSIGAINDRAFSTGIPGDPSATSSSSSTTSPTSASASSPATTPAPSSSGLSPGAAAGIGVAVGLVALAAILLGLFLFCRRRKRTRTRTQAELTELPHQAAADGLGSKAALASHKDGAYYGQIDHKYRVEVDEGQRHELSGVPPAELGAGEVVSRELPATAPGEERSPVKLHH